LFIFEGKYPVVIKYYTLFLMVLFVSCNNNRKAPISQNVFGSDFYKGLSINDKKRILDSIAATSDSFTNDSVKTDFLFRLAAEYYYLNQFKKSLAVSEKVYELALVRRDTFSIARAQYYKADCYEFTNKDSAYYYYHEAEKIYRILRDNERIGHVLFKKAYILFYEGNYVESEAQVSEALQLLKKSNNHQLLYSCYALLGYNFEKLEEFDNALKYFNLSKVELEKLKQLDVDFEKTNNYSVNHIINICNVYEKMGNYSLAIAELEKVKTDSLKRNWPKDYASVLGNLGTVKMKAGNLNGVEAMFRESLAISKRYEQQNTMLFQLLNLSDYYALKKDTLNAIQCLKNAQVIATKLKAGNEIKSILTSLGTLDRANTLLHSQRFAFVSDSIEKVQRNNRNKFARIEYETSVIEDKNRMLSTERAYILFVSLVLILCLSALLIFRYFKNQKNILEFRKQKQLAEEEIFDLLKKNQDQLNQAKIQEQNRISKELHDGVMNKIYGVRMQLGILNDSDSNSVKQKRFEYIDLLQEIEQEIRSISHDLQAEKLEEVDFKGLLSRLIDEQNAIGLTHYAFTCSTTIDWIAVSGLLKINIYRIIQEAIQNITKHAKAKHCTIEILKLDKRIDLLIADDGIGFDSGLKGYNGIGLSNIKERVTLMDAQLSIDSSPGLGTKIRVSVLC